MPYPSHGVLGTASLPVSVRRRLSGGEGACVRAVGLGVMSHRRLAFLHISSRVLRRRLRTYGWSWGAGRPAWLPMWPPPRQLHAAALPRLLAGPVDQPLEGGLCPGPRSELPELRVGPALPPLFLGGAVALSGGLGVGGCGGIVGTGGTAGPGGVLVVLLCSSQSCV